MDSDSMTSTELPTTDVAASDPAFRRAGGKIFAVDRAELPERCVVCGDSFELSSYRTILGRVRYHVCREHRIAAVAKLAAGAGMMLIAAWYLGGPILGGTRPGMAMLLGFGLIFVGGAGLVLHAIPVHAGRARDGWRRLWGAGRVVRGVDAPSPETTPAVETLTRRENHAHSPQESIPHKMAG